MTFDEIVRIPWPCCCKAFHNATAVVVRRWAELGLPDKPKLHMLMHLSHGTSVFKKGTARGLSPDNVALSFGFWGFSPPFG